MKNIKSKTTERECNDCEKVIPEGRLLLFPNAETCVVCQDYREKKGDFQRHKMNVRYVFKCDEIESTEETIVRGSA